jgi:diguanylate cyclase (GGDEF)-like protein
MSYCLVLPLQQAIDHQIVAVNPDCSMKDVINIMGEAKASCVLVLNQQQLAGIITEKDVVKITAKQNNLATTLVADVMTKKVITIKATAVDNALEVLNLMRQHRIRHLPVIDEQGQVIGIFTPKSLRSILQPTDMLRLRLIDEVMTTQVIQASPTTSLLDVTQQMAKEKVSCIVISETTTKGKVHPVGIITEQDIVKLQAQELDLKATQAQQVMTTPLISLKDSDSLWYANKVMYQHHIRRLVVTGDDGELRGIITQSSVLRVLDPIEMQTLVNILQEVLEERTKKLKQVNQSLQQVVAERLEIEAALLESEARYRTLSMQQAEICQQLEMANQHLQRLATSDGLTGLANRRHFDDYFLQEWRRLAREEACISLILCDVDYFKNYNDTYGHQAGDNCLRQIANLLLNSVKRPADLVARYGGEEFIILLPNTNVVGAIHVAQKIRLGVKSLQIPHINSQTSEYVTLSLGVATTIPHLDNNPADLIATADSALYKAKYFGRDRVQTSHYNQ